MTTRDKALAVLVLTQATRRWLMANDPQAWAQALASLREVMPDVDTKIADADTASLDPAYVATAYDETPQQLAANAGVTLDDDDGCPGCLTASLQHPCRSHGCVTWCRAHYGET